MIENSHALVKIAGNLDGQKSDELMIAVEKQIIPGLKNHLRKHLN